MQQAPYSNAPDLANKKERQAALRRYHILDTAPEKNFDRITSLVADLCDVSSSLISLIDSERQWFKSCFNFNARETEVGVSFCVHAVHQGELLIVEDATKHPDFKDNPLVTGPPHIRFYAGAPLTTPEGVHIGSLCIIDFEPRAFDAAQREVLERLADLVVSEFELRSAEAQFRQLFDENPQPMYVHAAESGELLSVNQAALQQYGYDRSSFVGRSVDVLRAPEDAQPTSGQVVMHVRNDGSYLPVQIRQSKILYDGDTAYLSVPRRVSDRRDSDQTLFFQTDMEGVTQSLSPAWSDVTGFSVAETVGESLLDFLHPLDRRSTREAFQALLDGETDACVHEARFSTERGSQTFEMHARLLIDNDDVPTGVAGSLTPVIDYEDVDFANVQLGASEDRDAPEDEAVDRAVEDQENAQPQDADASVNAELEDDALSDAESNETDAEAPEAVASPSTAPDAENADEDAVLPDAMASDPLASDPLASEPSADGLSDADVPPAEDGEAVDEQSGASFLRDLGIDEEAAPGTLTPGRDNGEASSSGRSSKADAHSQSSFERDEGGDGSIFGTSSDPDAMVDPKLDAIRSSDVNPSTFDLLAYIRDAVARQERHHGGTLDVQTDLPDAPVEVYLDPRFVDAVITVLLSNAIQYSGGEGVAVRCRVHDTDVVIEVQDAGSSIEERFLDDYVNASEDGVDASEDIQAVHDLVHRMEGRVNMESSSDSGTVFTISLPQTTADDPSADLSDDLFPLA